jgi:hypothetical protein
MMINYFSGHIILRTEISIDQLAKVVSKALFGNIPFVKYDGGQYEGVQTYYIDHFILGLEILLQEAHKFEGAQQYVLKLSPNRSLDLYPKNSTQINIDEYLRLVAKLSLSEYPDILVTDLR